MTNEELKLHIRNIPDFPIEGIQFKDITTLFKNNECLNSLAKSTISLYKNFGITKVVGIESRGFILGSILANELNAGFVPARKPGKLPSEVLEESYQKEYGTDTIQIHKDAITENDVVLIHDDLLATGGTMLATFNLVKKFNVKNVYINFIVELEELNGRSIFPKDVKIDSLIKFSI